MRPWDWKFYAEQVRKAKYDLDEAQVKPYFELNRVLQDGVFYAAHELYGLTFKERKDIPVYQPDVRVFEVFDANGKPLALFYFDYFKRDNKDGGAWMSKFVGQSKLLGTLPVIYNVANFQKPAPGQPALISFRDVTTMFHEFGHGLHGMFADTEYPSLSGTSVPRDFVEFPSQFNEHWASYPAVFKHYAGNYKTGAPMPEELVAKIKKAAKFNQGYLVTEVLAAAELDMQWHTLPANAPLENVDDFEKAALIKTHLNLAAVPPRYRSSYFLHIWANGYAAGYYAYSWTQMLDDAAFQWFEDHGGLTRANGDRFRTMVLSRGNTEDLEKMYSTWLGGKPTRGADAEGLGIGGGWEVDCWMSRRGESDALDGWCDGGGDGDECGVEGADERPAAACGAVTAAGGGGYSATDRSEQKMEMENARMKAQLEDWAQLGRYRAADLALPATEPGGWCSMATRLRMRGC